MSDTTTPATDGAGVKKSKFPQITMDQISIEIIDAEIAFQMLNGNTHNRNLRDRVVSAYSRDMDADEWINNGDPIRFAKDGTLLDGQHRLFAVIESNEPIEAVVIRGLPPRAQETMDGGAKRTFPDLLKLRGESQWVALSSIVRAVNLWERGARGGIGVGNYTPTNSELFVTLDKYPWLRDVAIESGPISTGCKLPRSITGLCWWLFFEIDPEDCRDFFERLRTGVVREGQESMKLGHPVIELRRILADKNREETPGTWTALTIKAWNKYRDGEPVKSLKFRAGGAMPEAFPEPH